MSIIHPPAYYRDLLENLELSSSSAQDRQRAVDQFVSYALDRLECNSKPNITLSSDTTKVQEFKSFGHIDIATGHIWLYVKNRNLADLLRTLCHELVHYKQIIDGRIQSHTDGQDGSKIENEANSIAGVIMREYGRSNPHIFE